MYDRCRESEPSQVIQEDQQQHRRADVAHEEDEHPVDTEFQRAVVADFGLEYFPVEAPADEYAGEESAGGEQDVGREVVERVENRESEDVPSLQNAQRQRCHGGQRHAGSGRGTGVHQVHSSCRVWKKDITTSNEYVDFSYAGIQEKNQYEAVDAAKVHRLAELC